MLNGKFVCVKGIPSWTTKGKVYEVVDGCFVRDNGEKTPKEEIHDIEDLNRLFVSQFEPYKETLTINDLEIKRDKIYIDNNNREWKSNDKDLYDVNYNPIGLVYGVKEILSLEFTEVNPNQERIDELNEQKKHVEDMKRMYTRSLEDINKELEGLM